MEDGKKNDPYYRETYTVRTYEIDHQKRMTVPALVRLMQEAAMQQVIQLKLSVWDLEPEHLAWVMMRMELKVISMPVLDDQITVKTSPTGMARIFTYRGFWVYDQHGLLIAHAITHWVLMDMRNRKLRSIPDWIRGRFHDLVQQEEFDLEPSGKKFAGLTEADLQKSFRVRWHDLDFNLHLNNTYYLLYLLEGLPAGFLTENTLTDLDIQYKAEIRQDEIITVEVQQISPTEFLHRMSREDDGRILAEMKSGWTV